ncbi:FecR domain-containing protein [Sphingomonas sp. TREG-RG-20F-R18-01]|uniref:FecR family protein n=1 Tax=Sphingomonas sp. TREG-RG-20F-R18-01 TaxID=2914982 RepID=UPI001F5AB018|nr:FecR domain-containing protein [Sphingomonas sp. TREG-RG-20F-R18-01]
MDQAIDWHLRQRDMSDAEWRTFVAWLEADPANAAAFDAVALDMSLIADHSELFPAEAAEAVPPVERKRARTMLRWGVGAGALALAASLSLVVLPSLPNTAAQPYAVSTRPGEQRVIALADGTRIDLNGASRIELDRSSPRLATLVAGEATFHVHHDSQAPFVLRSGTLSVQDVGTVFNAERDGYRLDVQVAEGAVLFQPRRDKLMLRAGAAVTARDDTGHVAMSRIDPARVGGWRNGDITFAGEPFGRLANALRRLDGVDVTIEPVLSQRPFTGMVHLTGKAAQDVPHLAALIGADWQHDGKRWVISPQ